MKRGAAAAAAACGSLGGDSPHPPTRISSWVWAGVGSRGGVGFGVAFGAVHGWGGRPGVASPDGLLHQVPHRLAALNGLSRHFLCLGFWRVGVLGALGCEIGWTRFAFAFWFTLNKNNKKKKKKKKKKNNNKQQQR